MAIDQVELTANYSRQDEVVRGLGGLVKKNLHLIPPIARTWNPADILPQSTDKDYPEKAEQIKASAGKLPIGFFVAVAGNTVTELALANYPLALARYDSVADASGTDDGPWQHFVRSWTADEFKHGEGLSEYLKLTARTNSRALSVSTATTLANGFNPRLPADRQRPYPGLIYTSFQEHSTEISHRNSAELAEQYEESVFEKLGKKIAADERRHKVFYRTMASEVFRQDPAQAVIEFDNLMDSRLVMPAALMTDGELLKRGTPESNLFQNFSVVTQRLGIYTVSDYANIYQELMDLWNVENLSVAGEAAKAQDKLAKRLRVIKGKSTRITEEASKSTSPLRFEWIFGQEVN